MLRRLDVELVRRHLAKSRESAQNLIENGKVLVDNVVSNKPSRQVSESVSIVINESTDRWVSRGAHKLLGAIDKFTPQGFSLKNRIVLDAGASTGGFTQVCLEFGAAHVSAVDVGYGQLAWNLRQDDRVFVLERFNIRSITTSDIPFPVEVVVADLSFISLKTVLPAIAGVVAPNADLLLMVKPQFEVGKDLVGDGVITDPSLRHRAVHEIAHAAQALRFGLKGVCASPLPGPSGNVEYFVWLRLGAEPRNSEECASLITQAILEGPQ